MGALIQNINHGISTPMLFFIVGMLYERRHTRQISEFGGLKKVVPMLAAMLLIATLASIAVPFFNGFVGEFPILQGTWISSMTGVWPTAIAATGMILSAVYMLWWFQRLMLGPITSVKNRRLPDLSLNEWVVLTPLVVIVFWFGLSSGFWTHRMESSVSLLVPAHTEMLSDDYPTASSTLKDKLDNERLTAKAGHMLFEPMPTIMVERPSIEPILYKDIQKPRKWDGKPHIPTGPVPGSPASRRPQTGRPQRGGITPGPMTIGPEGGR
jgi:NADH-quinone oxidoreductase subunit M